MAFTPNVGGGGSGYTNDVLATLAAAAKQIPFTGTAVKPSGGGTKKNYSSASPMPFSLNDIGAQFGDPNVMAHNQFAPQYDLLDQLSKQAEGKYTQAGNTIGGMYDSLAAAMRGEEAGIKKNYADTGSSIGKAFNDAVNATNNSFGQSRNEIAAIAKRLGVSAGIPSALAGGAEQQQRLSALLAANSANLQGVNSLLGNNDVAYNRNSADTARLAGVNAKKDYKSKLMDVLAGYGNKRLELQGAEQEAANKYGLSIADMKQQAQLAHDKMLADAQQNQQSNEFRQAQLLLDQSRFGLETDKFNASQAAAANKAPSNLSPYEALASTATKLYGNPVAAGNAAKAIEDTFTRGYNGDKNWANASEFIDAVMRRNPNSMHNGGDYQQLQQLALQFYTALAGGAGKGYGVP